MGSMDEIEWNAVPAETESGKIVIVTTRSGLERIRDAGKHKFRVEVSLDYISLSDGMPEEAAVDILETITKSLLKATARDKAAILSTIHTGDGCRDWVFHTTSLHIFQKIFNRALEKLPLYPFKMEAYEDMAWEDYNPITEIL